VDLPILTSKRLTLRPLANDDMDLLAAIVAAPGVSEWWGRQRDPEELEDELRSDGTAFTIEVGGEIAGWLGVYEESATGYRHAALDIVLAPEHQDQGLGSEALRLAVAWLIEARGHHRFTIDPAVDNERAIRCYEAVGFQPVGVMRSYEQGPDGAWHDNLLMDLRAGELRQLR
jgi:aminoglycoside 6'-N-acetyltransferase